MENQPFEFTITAQDKPEGIMTQAKGSGVPESGQKFEATIANITGRSIAVLYESWLLASGRENKPETKALFFADMQPRIMRIFMEITNSWQFQKSLDERKAALTARKAEAPKKENAA